MTDCISPDVLDFCPTQAELQPQFLAMLPRGRAWGEGGPGREPGGVIYQFCWAIAGVIAFVHHQLCALALEFVCQTATLTLDLWLKEYGLPDGCEPYPNLCAKVAAIGGATCAYYHAIALAFGWSITCGLPCALEARCIEAGMNVGPSLLQSVLVVVIDLADSPGGTDITALDCLLQRIVGAHLKIVYVFA